MKILSLFYILLIVNQSIQLNKNDFDMDYINYLIENFSENKHNRFLHIDDEVQNQQLQTRSLKDDVPKMKNFQKEFFHMIRDTVFQSIKSFIMMPQEIDPNEKVDKLQFPRIDTDMKEFLGKHFKSFYGDELKEDSEFKPFDFYKDETQDELKESQDQFFQFFMEFEGEQKLMMEMQFIPMEVKQRNRKKLKEGAKTERNVKSKEITVIFKNDIGEAKIKIPIVLGKDQRILDFISGNVEDFLGKSLQIVHDVNLLDNMLNNILNNNFAADNTKEEYDIINVTKPEDVKLDEGHELDSIIKTKQHQLSHTVYKLDINLDYSQEQIKEHFGVESEEITSKAFLYFLLVPNSQDLENIDIIIRLKDNKITYTFYSNFFTHTNQLDISTFSFVGFNFDIVCKQIVQDQEKNIFLLYFEPEQIIASQSGTVQEYKEKYDEMLKKNFEILFKKVFTEHQDNTLEIIGDESPLHDVCMTLELPLKTDPVGKFKFEKCYPKNSQFIVQIYQISFLEQFQNRLIMLYDNEEFEKHYLKQKIEPFVQLDKEKGFNLGNWQREIIPVFDKSYQKLEFSSHIVKLKYLVLQDDTQAKYSLINFKHKLNRDTRRLLKKLRLI